MLFNLAESVRLIAVLIAPVMPTVAGQIRAQMGLPDQPATLAEAAWGHLPADLQVGEVKPLFPKLEPAR